MIQREVEIWLFYPRRGGPPTQVRHWLTLRCKSEGWSLKLRPTDSIRTPEGRPLGSIRSEDATNLYKRIHRARVGVWQVGDAHAPIKPEPRTIVKDYVPLNQFVSQKAFHCRIPIDGVESQGSPSLTAFHWWLTQVWCEGESDPRCLPFPVFSTTFDVARLATHEGRSVFPQIHGPQSSRRDHSNLLWRRGANHGRETLHIAGRNLVRGFHWDVSSLAREQHVATTSEVWRIGPNGYVNVYPDQHIRLGFSARRLIPNRKAKAR